MKINLKRWFGSIQQKSSGVTIDGKKYLTLALTDECFAKIKSGQVEEIEADENTVIRIGYLDKRPEKGSGWGRGGGAYLFTGKSL